MTKLASNSSNIIRLATISSKAAEAERLRDSIRSLWQHRTLCDVVLESRSGKRVEVHRLVLAAASPTLCALVDNDWGEGFTIVLDVSDGALAGLVSYLYHVDCELQTNDALELQKVAHELGLNRLFCALTYQGLDVMNSQGCTWRCHARENGVPVLMQVSSEPVGNVGAGEDDGNVSELLAPDEVFYSSYPTLISFEALFDDSPHPTIEDHQLSAVESQALGISDIGTKATVVEVAAESLAVVKEQKQDPVQIRSAHGSHSQSNPTTDAHPRSNPTTDVATGELQGPELRVPELGKPVQSSPSSRAPRSDAFGSNCDMGTNPAVIEVESGALASGEDAGTNGTSSTTEHTEQFEPAEGRTTLMIRNIGNHISQKVLLNLWPIASGYDLFYMPYSTKRKRSLGFAFVNFSNSVKAENFMKQWQGFQIPETSRRIRIGWAEIQGFEKHVAFISEYSPDLCRVMTFVPVVLGPFDSSLFDSHREARESPFRL